MTLAVYNLLGHEVAVLVSGAKEAGRYEVTLNGSNLASGIYFYRLFVVPKASTEGGATAGGFVQTRKLMLLR